MVMFVRFTEYLVARGYTVEVHNDFATFISEDTASMTGPDIEEHLIHTIQEDINKRATRNDNDEENGGGAAPMTPAEAQEQEENKKKRKADQITQREQQKEREKELAKMRKQAGNR
jgi:outer membrane protein assembly factor BamE (lipoprotein component of BamABCDE complex)